MIADIWFAVWLYIIGGIIGRLPESDGFGTEVAGAFQMVGSYIHIFDPVVPWSVMFICVGIIYGVEIARFAWKTFKDFMSHLPVFGGKGN